MWHVASQASLILSATEEQAYLLGRAEVHRQLTENKAEIETRAIHLCMSRLYAEQAALIVLVLSRLTDPARIAGTPVLPVG